MNGTLIHNANLQNGIENQPITVQGSICNICKGASKIKKTIVSNRRKFGTRMLLNYRMEMKINQL